ncbi:Bug family tripartite tricarboxylate transporter substrate binding protein [Roseicella aerolata]|uniref:Tripartite tricarboxylate transporter substrate binding protein n=1 Tax=Roseicella aerolata TaxID=2883479 RepID=A0A9X1L9S1_9PROT|nr:tripartite tricarboxylate transporter substrate binding protein [Roseicella aerolata]MCB4824049.1 tripartite tricarboxylate transporter substrate binding protein [Roseicella aerolata]
MPATRRTLLAATLTTAALAAPAIVSAQATWLGGRPIRLVVGFPPGGSGDFLARTLGEALGRELGQTIVVDNRPGAGSNIATENVARSEPDGTSLLLGGNFSHAVNPAMFRRISFDPLADFTPITRICDLPTIIAVNPNSGIRTLQELLARIRAEPGRWNYGTPGIGTPSHLAGAMLSRVLGVELTHVPFRGGAPSMTALLAGDITMLIGTPPVVLPQSRAGKVTALSLTTREPSPVIPEIPGSGAAGLPALDIAGWWGLWAPARLPPDFTDRLFQAMRSVIGQPAVQERMASEGLRAWPSDSPAEFEAFLRKEIPFWAQVVKDAGATVE